MPVAQRSTVDSPAAVTARDAQTVEGRVKSLTCGEKDEEGELVIADSDDPIEFKQGMLILDNNSHPLTFRGKKWSAEFSDTLWYGKTYSDFCHRAVGNRALVRYKLSSDKDSTGDLEQVELRDDLQELLAIPMKNETKSKGDGSPSPNSDGATKNHHH